MKKIILTLCFVLSLASCSYGATSDDIYVRKDVFEVEMRNINSTLETILAKLDNQEKSINALTNAVAVLSERVDGNFAALSGRIDGLEKRMDTTNSFLYYLLVLIGAMMLLPFFNKWWETREEKKQAAAPTFTLDDVKRLIAEAKLGTTLSA